jgi:hypothetical protein
MSAGVLSNLAVWLVVITSVTILISRDWRWSLALLALQYVGVMLLVDLQWPLEMAATKLIVGWMAAVTLAISQIGVKEPVEKGGLPTGRLFRLLAAGLVLLMVFSLAARTSVWFPGVNSYQATGGLALLTIGLLQLGMTARPFRQVLGLLTLLSGFEILYSAVEVSVMVAGLLAVIDLGIALVGAYLIGIEYPQEQP